MTKRQRNLVIFLALLLIGPVTLVTGDFSHAQVAENPQNDLRGLNSGEYIVFWFTNHDGTSEYIVYRSPSATGLWVELARIREATARTSGGKVDVTPDARLMDLCYRVEAIDVTGQVIRTYLPMCVPKFVP